MKIALIGANGQLGSDLSSVIPKEYLVAVTHKDIEVCDYSSVEKTLADIRPSIVINTTAYNRVDDAESNPEIAFMTNAYAVKNLSLVCNNLSAKLVHFTTDYVFDGFKGEPYDEEDIPNPISVYGISKYAGELFLRNYCKEWLLIRTTGLYGIAGSSSKGGNFVETMIKLGNSGRKLKVVNDQVVSPTFTKDLAVKVYELIQVNAWGIFHVTNSGGCSWYEFSREIFKLCGLNPQLDPTTSAEYGSKAKRPPFSVLRNKRLQEAGLEPLRHWREALKEYLKERGFIK